METGRHRETRTSPGGRLAVAGLALSVIAFAATPALALVVAYWPVFAAMGSGASTAHAEVPFERLGATGPLAALPFLAAVLGLAVSLAALRVTPSSHPRHSLAVAGLALSALAVVLAAAVTLTVRAAG